MLQIEFQTSDLYVLEEYEEIISKREIWSLKHMKQGGKSILEDQQIDLKFNGAKKRLGTFLSWYGCKQVVYSSLWRLPESTHHDMDLYRGCGAELHAF